MGAGGGGRIGGRGWREREKDGESNLHRYIYEIPTDTERELGREKERH